MSFEEIRLLHLKADRVRTAAKAANDDAMSNLLLRAADGFEYEARRLNLDDLSCEIAPATTYPSLRGGH